MKKTEVLRRQVLFLACVFVALGSYLVDSYLGVGVSATETLARLPASLVFGATADVKAPEKAVTKLEINCDLLAAPYQKAIATKWLQLQLTNCPSASGKFLIKNGTNGVEASLFKTNSFLISDLISLSKGENQIVISQVGKGSSFPSGKLLITLQ